MPDAAPIVTETGEVVIVESDRVHAAREALTEKLAEEGYHRIQEHGDYVVYLPDDPWKWRVRVYDDGWVEMRRSPPRVHAAGANFADEGKPANWLVCLVSPGSCVDFGTSVQSITDHRVVREQQFDIATSTAPEVNELGDALSADALRVRLNDEIPERCAAIWSQPIPAADRHRELFELWNSRTETPEGEAVRDAIEAFVRGVVQTSAEPYSADELAQFDAQRSVERRFLADGLAER